MISLSYFNNSSYNRPKHSNNSSRNSNNNLLQYAAAADDGYCTATAATNKCFAFISEVFKLFPDFTDYNIIFFAM